jgi:hypothetical protein
MRFWKFTSKRGNECSDGVIVDGWSTRTRCILESGKTRLVESATPLASGFAGAVEFFSDLGVVVVVSSK